MTVPKGAGTDTSKSSHKGRKPERGGEGGGGGGGSDLKGGHDPYRGHLCHPPGVPHLYPHAAGTTPIESLVGNRPTHMLLVG